MTQQHGWYRASDGYWYYGSHPQPFAVPPQPDGRGGWTQPVAAPPAPPAYAPLAATAPAATASMAPRAVTPAGAPGWIARHKKLSVTGGVLGTLMLVGALSGEETTSTRPVADTGALRKTTAPAIPAPTTAAPPATRRPVVAVVTPTATKAPATTRPVAKPAPKPAPKPAAKPAPKPTAKPRPAPLPTCGAPANPWGYNFCGRGSLISNPPAAFCSYFDCIASFWESTNGYVMQCADSMFSHSGGRQGSCSHHGGNNRPLYG